MSEYQYYEFAAVDGPISDEGMRYARSCSSRAQVSRFRWQNTYHFGDFHGSVDTLLKYYDAHFYIANWGTVRVGVSFPEGCLPPEVLQRYARKGDRYETTLTAKKVGNRHIVWWERNEEQGWGWTEGEGILDQLVGVRAELMRGDYRALFLGWLADFHPDDWKDSKHNSALVPPIPPGLNHLSPSLAALIEHFPVDEDALAVAAALSETHSADPIPVARVIEKLPTMQMRALLQRVADGEGAKVMSELNRLTCRISEAPASQAMTCAEFAARTFEIRKSRREKEAAAAEATRKRKEEARRQHLATVRQHADTIWASLDLLLEQKIASAYDQAATQLQDLHAAHEQSGESARFDLKLAVFRERYARRPAMLRRIAEL